MTSGPSDRRGCAASVACPDRRRGGSRHTRARAMTTRRRPAPFALATFALGAILLHARAVLGDDDQSPPPSPPPRRRRASFPLRASPGARARCRSFGPPRDAPRPPRRRRRVRHGSLGRPTRLAAFKAARAARVRGRAVRYLRRGVRGGRPAARFRRAPHAYAPPIAPCAPATTLVAEASDTNTAVVDGPHRAPARSESRSARSARRRKKKAKKKKKKKKEKKRRRGPPPPPPRRPRRRTTRHRPSEMRTRPSRTSR